MRRSWRRRRPNLGTVRFEIPTHKRRKFVFLVVAGAFLISLWLSFWVIDTKLRPSLELLALAKAKVMATSVINQAVAEGDARAIKYQDLMSIKNDQSGRPVLLQPNTGELNRLAARITLDVQRALLGLEKIKVYLPVGQVLGSRLLGSWGPQIGVSLLPVGTAKGQIVDSFTVAGINQTRHRISLRVTTEVKVAVPLVSATAEIQTDVPLVEAIILGEVPDFYMNGVIPQP